MTTTAGSESGTIDAAALDAFAGFAGVQASAALNATLVALGDRLGLWKALAAAGPLTSSELAVRTGLDERHLREWLAAQAANGFIGYDPTSGTFSLSPEAAMVLADEDSPALMIAAFQGIAAVCDLLPALEQTFRTGDGIAWHDHEPAFFDVQERFARPLQRAMLVDVWLAAVPGLFERLEAGATVADVGCGYGGSTVLLAARFPASRFTGFDFHDHSIARARNAARHAGVGDRATFEVADASSFPGSDYDVVMFVDCLHDLGDPLAAARHARSTIGRDGVVVALDPVSEDTLAANLANPMAGMMYAVSNFLCLPTAKSQPGPHALGAMGGATALQTVLREAGFSHVERVAPDAPFNMILVARP